MANEFIARNGVIALANSTVSGSLSVTNSVSGSVFTGSFIGELTGTSSYASFANTASFATLAYSASYFSGSISNAVFATSASFAATASYALNAGAGGGGTVGGQALLTQSLAATTWSFNHNLGTTYPVITVYDGPSNSVIQPLNIVSSGSNNINIFFSSPKSGYATAVAGGGYFVTNNGTTRKLVQSTPAVTWSFVHNIGDQYPAFEIYDSNNNIVIPANIRAVDAYTAEIQFAYSASGTAVATLGGGIGVGDVITIPSASSNWSIQHNLNTTYPIVTIWESGSNQIVQPDTISSVDANNILVTFTTPVKGFANVSRAGSVISGSTDWNLLINKPNVGVVYSQTTPSATWSIAHNLGTQFPLVTVYDSSNAVVLPQSIVGTDSNNITITFPTAQTGTVNVSKAGNYISGSILWSNITSGPFSTTGSITRFTGSLIITGSLTVSGSGTFNNVGPANFTGSLNVTGSLNTIGTITATTLVVQTITSSISSITGSTSFGSSSINNHNFTGSLIVSGAMFVSSSGNIGIGTISPTDIAGYTSLTINNSSNGPLIDLNNSGVNNMRFLCLSAADQRIYGAGNLSFYTSGSTRMNITSTGNIGIGVTPAAWGNSSYNIKALQIGSNGSLYNLDVSTSSTRLYLSNNTFIDSAVVEKYIATGPATSFFQQAGEFIWKQAASGTAGSTISFVEAMRITTGGNVFINYNNVAVTDTRLLLVGQTAAGSTYSLVVKNSNLANLLYLRDDGRINTGTLSASPYNDTTGNAANMNVDASGFLNRSTASSLRYKENINEWDGKGLETILSLKPKTFTYKADYYKHPDVVMLGLIAEEVAEVSPYLAEYENEDRTGLVENVRYANIVVPLVKAIQELTARVQELENK